MLKPGYTTCGDCGISYPERTAWAHDCAEVRAKRQKKTREQSDWTDIKKTKTKPVEPPIRHAVASYRATALHLTGSLNDSPHSSCLSPDKTCWVACVPIT